MRPAYLLAETAGKFACDIEIENEDMRVDAKSALSILTLGATRGTMLQVHASGPEARQAVHELAAMIGAPFSEEIGGDTHP